MVTLDKSKILVTGSSGYIGSHLREWLPFMGLDQNSSVDSERKFLGDFAAHRSDYSEVETVIHLADRRLQDIHQDNLKENVLQHRRFLEQVQALPRLKRLIFSSSCSVYGFSESWVTELSTVNPTSFYAESKLHVESLIHELKLPHLILRFGTAHGWSPVMREDLFVNELAKTAAKGGKVDIYSAEAWRPYVHCRDFARVLAQAALGELEDSLVNVVTENFTKNQILNLPVLKNSRLQSQVSPQGDPRNYKVQVRSELFSQHITMEQGLQEMLVHYGS